MISTLWASTATAGREVSEFVAVAVRIAGIGILIQSLEIAWNRREFPRSGLLGWRGSGTPPRSTLIRGIRWLHQPPAVFLILLARAAAAGAIAVAPADGLTTFSLLSVLLAAQAYYNRRFYDIASNADAMYFTSLTGLWIGSLPGASDRLRSAGLLFVGIYVAVAYFSTGWNKLTSVHWRNGDRLRQIFLQGGRGFAPIGARLAAHRPLARVAAWSVILLELVLPLAPMLPTPVFGALLAAGICFHGTVAVTMGLHDFFWAFATGYPALWFAHRLIGA